ncbi:MAG: hemerythrin domain-containing protein [Acidimicrobiales bacterium]
MTDITQVILDEHDWFRRRFADLDNVSDPDDLDVLWKLLAGRLEIHASAEEDVFYPVLLRKGDDAEAETEDAIGDHDEIREAVRDTVGKAPGSKEWWAAVRKTEEANSDHMAEEERGPLADFRRHVTPDRRDDLGRRLSVHMARHITIKADLESRGPSPDEYLEEHAPD